MNQIKIFFSNQKNLWISAGVCLALAMLLIYCRDGLSKILRDKEKEYQTDVALSKESKMRRQIYETVLNTAKLPERKQVSSNTWVQETQVLVTGQKLSLQELKPDERGSGKGESKPSLYLVVEGNMADLLSFFYRISENQNFVYVNNFMVTRPSDNSDGVSAEVTLSQM